MWRRLIFIITMAIFFVVVLQFLPVLKSVNSVISPLTTPMSQSLYGGINYISRWISSLFNTADKMNELENLKSEMRRLNSQLAGLQILASENETLKKQLGFLQEFKHPYISARVTARVNQGGQPFLILDKGENEGVVNGLPVIVDNGVIVGKISKTEKHRSFLLVSTANQSRIAATLAAQSNTTGLVRGDHNISLKMELVPKNVPISRGDIVVTSGLEPLVPRGLVIGKVDEILNKPNDIFQSAYLQSLFSISDLQIVTIILSDAK